MNMYAVYNIYDENFYRFGTESAGADLMPCESNPLLIITFSMFT